MATTATRSIYINGKQADATLKGLTELANRFRNELRNAELDTKDYVEALKGLKQTNALLQRHQSELRGVSGAVGGIKQGLSGVAGFVGAAFAVDRLIDFGTQALKIANDTEQVTVALETMLGSKKEAEQLQSDLINLAAKTPFELPQIQTATKQLLAYGFSAKEVIPNLSALGNIASGVGMEKLPQLILAFGQVRAATKLTGNELRQFTEAGVPMLEELAKIMKKPVSEIQKMVSDGQVGFKVVQQALMNLTTEGGRFAGLMEKQSQTLGGLWSTFKDTFTQNVLLPVGNGLAKVIKPALLGLTDLATSIGGVTTKADALRLSIEKERQSLGVLINRITDANTSQKTRKELISQLQKDYPSFLGNISTETASNAELRDRLQEVNKAYMQKIVAIEASKGVEEAMKTEQKAQEKMGKSQFESAQQLSRAQDILNDKTLNYAQAVEALRKKKANLGTFDIFKREEINQLIFNLQLAANSKPDEYLNIFADRVTAAQQKQKQIIDNIRKANPQLAKDIEELLNPTASNDPKKSTDTEGGQTDKKAQKEIESDRNKLQKLRENLVNYQNDIAQLKDAEHREELKIVEKYNKQIAEVKKLYDSKDRDTRTGAAALVKELEGLKNEELVALTQKGLKALEAEYEQHQAELTTKRLSDDEREAAEIAAKYEKKIRAAVVVETNMEYATAQERARAHQLRLKYEADRDREIAEARAVRLAAQQLKDQEGNEAFFQKMAELNQRYADLMNIKPVNIANETTLTPEQRLQNLREQANLEIAELVSKFDQQIKLEGDASDRVLALRQKLATLTAAIRTKEATDEQQITTDTNEKRLKATAEMYTALGSLVASAGELFATEGGKQSAATKVLTLAQIAFDTAAAISSLMKHSEANPANTATFGIAGTIQFATGLARVLSNVARAKKLLFDAPKVQQKREGGFTEVIGQDDGQRYRAQFIGAPQTGLLSYPNPVLTASGVLGNEKGVEYFVSNASLRKPAVNYLVRMIDNIERGTNTTAPQRKSGGYTTETLTPTPTDSSGDISLLLAQHTAALNRLNAHLDKGIRSNVTIGYPQVDEITTAQERLKNIEG